MDREWQLMDDKLAAEVNTLSRRIQKINELRANLLKINTQMGELFTHGSNPIAKPVVKTRKPAAAHQNGKVEKMNTQNAIAQALQGGNTLLFDELSKVINSMDIPGKPASYKNLKARIGVVLQAMKAKKTVENTPQGWRLV